MAWVQLQQWGRTTVGPSPMSQRANSAPSPVSRLSKEGGSSVPHPSSSKSAPGEASPGGSVSAARSRLREAATFW